MLDFKSGSTTTAILQGTYAELAQSIFQIKGAPLTYKDQDYMVTAVDSTAYDTILMRTGRQVGKTVTQGVRSILTCIMIPDYKVLYVSPSFKQTKRFSNKCINQLCRDSPFIQTEMIDPALTWSIEEKTFKNNSSITLHYAFHTADRSRGESMDFLKVDELQDIIVDNLPVLEQTLVHSKPPPGHPEWAPFFKKKLYTGTPKSLAGTIEHFWKESTQCVWVVPCSACGGWNQLTARSIGKHGTICNRNATRPGGKRGPCGHPIDPRNGMWHQLKPDARKILGVHVSQLMAPRTDWGPHGWIDWENDILAPFENRAPGWDTVRVHNEILGLPCESALRAVTQAEVMACCEEGWLLRDTPDNLCLSTPLYAGVDWGETRSRTVLTIGGRFADGRWAPVFVRRYVGDECDPNFLIADILKWCSLYGVRAIGCDVGHGFGLNSQLVQDFGMDRIFPIRYAGKTVPRLVFSSKHKWEWTANRSTVLGEYFMAIKRQRVKFPRWAQWEAHAKDILNVFIEFSGRAKDMMYAHGVGLENADDGVHSAVYCQLAEEITRGSFVMDDDSFYH